MSFLYQPVLIFEDKVSCSRKQLKSLIEQIVREQVKEYSRLNAIITIVYEPLIIYLF